jgi:selenide,water dikinase
MLAANAHACTDITGYGLAGHARNIAKASGVTIELVAGDAPLFPGAYELAERGILSGASKRGREGLKDEVRVAPSVDETLANMLFDAETSGGLLIAVAQRDVGALERELAARKVPVHRIGHFVAHSGVHVSIV